MMYLKINLGFLHVHKKCVSLIYVSYLNANVQIHSVTKDIIVSLFSRKMCLLQ